MKFNPVSKILWVFIGIAVFIVAAILFFGGYEKWQKSREIREFNELLVRPYKEDIYGGDTPQETYEMFLQALRDEDVEMAAKMFVVERQEEWLEELRRIQKDEGSVGVLTDDFPEWNKLTEKEQWRSGLKEYYTLEFREQRIIELQGREFVLPAGEIANTILFKKNDFTGKWKLDL